MEVEIAENITFPSFNSGRISLDDIKRNTTATTGSGNCLISKQQRVALDLYNDQDDEGEIMLLAMILLQLHGVKFPISEDDNDLLNKKKRQRTSPDQLAILEQIFQTDKMPNQQTRVQLADQLGMSSRRVQIWFQNKRAKVKRSVSKQDGDCPDSPLSVLRQSSSSLSPPSSPSSPSGSLEDESPILSPSLSPAVVPPFSLFQQQPQPLPAPIVITPSSITKSPNPSPTNITTTILDNTTIQLKAQQLQFSLTSPFDNQPLLAATY